jgi:hypothetical protein
MVRRDCIYIDSTVIGSIVKSLTCSRRGSSSQNGNNAHLDPHGRENTCTQELDVQESSLYQRHQSHNRPTEKLPESARNTMSQHRITARAFQYIDTISIKPRPAPPTHTH